MSDTPQAPRAAATAAGFSPRALAAGALVLTALALWMVWPAFTPGRIVNLDAPRHLLRTVVMATQFLPSGHVDGWSPWWFLGAQLFLFQSYGYFLLIGASALFVSPLAPLGLVFKAWYVLPIVVLPAATALLARRLGVGPRGALAAGLASVVFSSPQGYGMDGLFVIGLLLQGAGVVGFSLAWPEMLAVLLDRDRAPWRAVLVVAVVLIVHFITGAYTLAAAGLVAAGLALGDRTIRPLARYLLVASLVLLLAGHSLFPSLEWRELSGIAVGWGSDRDRFQRFLAGTLFGGRPLALAALVAAAWSVRFGPRPLRITAIVLLATALAGGGNAQGWEPAPLRQLLDVFVRPRALPYAALLLAVFFGAAAEASLSFVERRLRAAGRLRLAAAAAPVATCLLLAWAQPQLSEYREDVKTESLVAVPEREVYDRLVAWLRENVEPPAVVAVPRVLFPDQLLGARSVISLLNLDTGLYTLGGDQAELVRPVRRSFRVNLDALHENPARNARLLRAAGVSHVILSDADLRRRLAGKPGFELVFEFRREKTTPVRRRNGKSVEPVSVGVFRVVGGGTWLHGNGVTVGPMEYSPELVSWPVDVAPGRPTREVTASINWHPNWKAYVDGTPVEARSSPTHHVAFRVPPGARRVTLAFERSAREKGYDALSALTLVGVIAASRRDARRRRRLPLAASTPEHGDSA